MELNQEPKLDIGIGVTLRYVLAIRIELERMPATVLPNSPASSEVLMSSTQAFDCSRIARLIKSPNPR